MDFMFLLHRIAVDSIALLFLLGGFTKLAGLGHFRTTLLYIPYLPTWATYLVAGILPPAELAIALGLIRMSPMAHLAGIAVMGVFIVVALMAIAKTVKVPCNCFGADRDSVLSWATIKRNLVLIAILALPPTNSAMADEPKALFAGLFMIAAFASADLLRRNGVKLFDAGSPTH